MATPNQILGGHIGCPGCVNHARRVSQAKTQEEYTQELSERNDSIIVLGEYVSAYVPILHKCLICEYEWLGRPGNILSGAGCPRCAAKLNSLNKMKTHEQYVKELNEINNKIYPIEKYKGAHVPILHNCFVCDNIWKITPSDALRGNSCPNCKSSKSEKFIAKYLDNQHIFYERQKRFQDCRDQKPLPFDFYIPNRNIAIEYDGIQHFQPVYAFGGEEGFLYTQKHDQIKNQYCETNNIKLLRIPYYKNIEEELNNFILT